MKKTYIIIALIIGVSILLALSIFIGGSIYKENQRITWEAQQVLLKNEQFNNCTKDASDVYLSNWESICKLDNLGKDCALPKYRSEDINKRFEDAKDRCVQLYK